MHEALRDPSVGDVETLSERVGISRRTLERLASRFFGFPPKTLLRRQRFLRSLGKFTIEPGRSWSASLDGHYVDQAHFVREFRAFMEMTPSEYAQMPHPVLGNIFTKRLTEQGAH
nr:helix-turn-helix domain-containing protein [Aurantiacibacter rhizosphaerae]